MTERLTGWETTRLSKHFILLDFLADREVYRSRKPLAFNDIWSEEREALAKGLCKDLLEPLMVTERVGPFSVADAFVPSVLNTEHAMPGHRWAGGEATVDLGLYGLVERKLRGQQLRDAVLSTKDANTYCDHAISYPGTEFVCITFKQVGVRRQRQRSHISRKKQNLRAHHVRVGRYFNLLDFCRNGWAVETGCDLVPKAAEMDDPAAYHPVPEEMVARSFAAALDPLVEVIGRVSVVRGMETERFADDAHAELHRWDRGNGPWRLVIVLPHGEDPERACTLLKNCSHVLEVQASRHASGSSSLALRVDRKEYDGYCGLRLGDPQ